MGVMNGYLDVASSTMGQQSIAPPEEYIELWWYSGSYTYGSASTSGSDFIQRGSTSPTTNKVSLHTLNTNWNPNNKYALEASLFSNTTGFTEYAALYDLNTNSVVSGSQISSTGTTATVVRSGQFTLTPGHLFAVTVWSSTGANTYITDASLIVFPS